MLIVSLPYILAMSAQKLANRKLVKVDYNNKWSSNKENIIEFEGTQYTVSKSLFCNFAPSPYPVYVCNLLFFIPYAVNLICLDAVLFNKICYFQYKNQTQCADPDFSVLHPELQVRHYKCWFFLACRLYAAETHKTL